MRGYKFYSPINYICLKKGKKMKENKLKTITNLFENNTIRSIWNAEKDEYYFSVVDVIGVLI